MGDISINPERNLGRELPALPIDPELKVWMEKSGLSFSTGHTWLKYKSQLNIWNDHQKVKLPKADEIGSINGLDRDLLDAHVVTPIHNTWGRLVKSSSTPMTLNERIDAWQQDHETQHVNCQVPLVMTMAWVMDNHLKHEVMMSPNAPHPVLVVETKRNLQNIITKCAKIDFADNGSLCIEEDSIWGSDRRTQRMRLSYMYSEGPVTTMRFLDFLTVQAALVYDRKRTDIPNLPYLKHALDREFYNNFKPSDKDWLIGYWENQRRLREIDDS
jgi:hypothetical protein